MGRGQRWAGERRAAATSPCRPSPGPPLPAPGPPAPRVASSLELAQPRGVPAPYGGVFSPQCRLRLPGMSGGVVTQEPSSEPLLKGLEPGPSSSRLTPR